jgi:hypothetical protein
MMGAWQIDPTNTRIWTEEEFDSARRAAEVYKAWIRPLLQDAKVHHVLPRPDGVHWDGMFYWSASLRRGTLFVFRPDSEEAQKPVRLKGLEPAERYWVWGEDGSVPAGTKTGEELMRGGLPVSLPERYSSDLVYVQAESLGRPDGLAEPGAFRLGKAETDSDEFTTSAVLRWEPSSGARSYRVRVARTADFREVVMEKTVLRPSVSVKKLPPGVTLYWSVEASSPAGKQTSEGSAQSFTTPALKDLPGVEFVSDLKWVKAVAGANNTVHRDTNYGRSTISIAGKRYAKGVWTHAFDDATPADVEIDVQGRGYGVFKAEAGVEDTAGPGSVQFQVLADGELKAESSVMRPGTVHRFDVAVAGAKRITLRVLNGGDGYSCDHAAWGWARFVQKDAADPLINR